MKNNILIGVCGGSASGKSCLSRELYNVFSGSSILLTQDDYYHDSSKLTEVERLSKNYDHPCAIDLMRLYENLRDLKNGQVVESPIYCFKTHSRLEKLKIVGPAPVIFVEGLFVFELPELRELLDLKVFLRVDNDIRFIRRMIRDVQERSRTIDSIVDQYLLTVKPMHDKFVEPASQYADIIVPSMSDRDIDNAVTNISLRINDLVTAGI